MNGIKGLFAKLGFVTQCAIVGTVLAQALAFGALYSRGDIAPIAPSRFYARSMESTWMYCEKLSQLRAKLSM